MSSISGISSKYVPGRAESNKENENKIERRAGPLPEVEVRLMARQELPAPLKVGRSSKLSENDLNTYLERLKSQRV
jgi:hypothetical protein